MTAATSSGVALRPSGVRTPCSCSCGVCDPVAIQPGASYGPGHTIVVDGGNSIAEDPA